MSARVIIGNTQSEPFHVNSGVEQGCATAPTLLVIFIASIMDLFEEKIPQHNDISIIYKTNSELFKLRRLKSKTKSKISILLEF